MDAPAQPALLLSRVPLRDQVFDIVRDMIVSGVIGPGDRLNEVDLAARLGISRGPLREAIQRLGAEGFVDFHQNRGAFVRTVSADDVAFMFEARQLIEVAAARLSAQRATDEDVRGLGAHLAAAESALSDDAGGSYPADLDLHSLVLELCGNPYLRRIGLDLQNQVRLARVASGRSPERARRALEEHRLIIDRISRRDSEGAAVAMAEHLRRSHAHSAHRSPALDR